METISFIKFVTCDNIGTLANSLADTFSHVAKIAFARFFLAMAAIEHWPLHQLDIKNAFLLGELQKEVYMDKPPSFTILGDSQLVCRLPRSLYGLKFVHGLAILDLSCSSLE